MNKNEFYEMIAWCLAIVAILVIGVVYLRTNLPNETKRVEYYDQMIEQINHETEELIELCLVCNELSEEEFAELYFGEP